MSKNRDLTRWNIPVSRTLNKAVEEAVRRDMHVSKADFVRDSVRQKLEHMGMSFRSVEEAPREAGGEAKLP